MIKMFNSFGGETEPPTANFRIASFNIFFGFGDNPSPEFTNQVESLQRIDADVVVYQELNYDASGSGRLYEDRTKLINDIMPAIGHTYYYSVNPDILGSPSVLYGAISSKYPLSDNEALTSIYINTVSGGSGEEMDRSKTSLRTSITVNGQELIIYNVHLASGFQCTSQNTTAKWRTAAEITHAVQLERVVQDWNAIKLVKPNAKLIIIGDFNDDDQTPNGTQTASYASLPSGIQCYFVPSADITFPYLYYQYPQRILTPNNIKIVNCLALNGDRNTHYPEGFVLAAMPNPHKLDYITVSEDITVIGGEVLESLVDNNTQGLPKYGEPLDPLVSEDVSDHRIIFADLAV